MGEFGIDDPQSIGQSDIVHHLPVKDSESQVVDIENSPEGKRLIAAIKKVLEGEGVKHIVVPPNKPGEVSRFVTVDTSEPGIQVCVRAMRSGEVDPREDSPRANGINATWVDKKKNEKGVIEVNDKNGGYTIVSDIEDAFCLEDEVLKNGTGTEELIHILIHSDAR
jgi:hypothetical protein